MTYLLGQTLTETDRLLQVHRLTEIEKIFDGPWVVLYESTRTDSGSATRFCALLADECLPGASQNWYWDLAIGAGLPGYIESDGKLWYEQPRGNPIEPLIFVRDFPGARPSEIEISEEFRHFHNLCSDHAEGRLIRIDDDGEEEIVVKITDDLVQVRKPQLNHFLASKQMYLALFFEFREHIDGRSKPIPQEDFRSSDLVWIRAIIPPAFITESDSKTISRLVGKRLISPPGRPRAGEKKRRRFVSFIIGYDGEGEPRHNTCDPDKLADNFGRNRGEPNYLTRVHFRRSVLDMYYKDSDRYSAGDGYVKAQGLWLLPVDNDLPDRVIVFLGDLANLPYKEQLHWRSHNILPEGGMSEMAVRRAFLAEPADATSADHAFKAKFEQFQSDWQRRVGWPLFRPLRVEDEHVWKGLHLPTGDTAAEFEEQILFLAKILNDSINDNQLSKALSEKIKDEKSLDKLERYLSKYNYPHVTRDLQILRILQRIRSTATAHRKGANYAKLIEEIGLVKKGKRHVFDSILERLTWMLADVESHFLKGEGVTNPNDG